MLIKITGKARDVFPCIKYLLKKYGNKTLKELEDGENNQATSGCKHIS